MTLIILPVIKYKASKYLRLQFHLPAFVVKKNRRL